MNFGPCKSSSYLRHGNKNGVIVLPAAVAASIGMKKIADAKKDAYSFKFQETLVKWLNAQRLELWNHEIAHLPVDIGQKMAEGNVYYPVRNRDYRQWRMTKGRGGDFLIMTEPKLVKLDQPIELNMPEVCI